MILVTVGTHVDPFDRLVRAADALARDTDEEVVLQRGTSTVGAPHCVVHDLLRPSELDGLLGRARVVVAHAGPATLLSAARHGKVPIVVPRQARYGEHVDDHQVAFARRVADRIHLLEDPSRLADAVAAVGPQGAPSHSSAAASRAFSEELDRLLRELLVEPPRRRLRDTFASLMRIAGLRG